MFVEDITTTRDWKEYTAQNEFIKNFLNTNDTKLFLTIRNKIDLTQHPRFPNPKRYAEREATVRKTMRFLRSKLKLRSKDFWFLAVHEKGQSSELSNSAHCHIVVHYTRDIDEGELATSLKSWASYSSRKFGLDICYRKHGKSNGSILIESQHRVAEYAGKFEAFYQTRGEYKPFWKRPFHSKNIDTWPPKQNAVEQQVEVAKSKDKPQIVFNNVTPIEKQKLELEEPIVLKNKPSCFLNLKSAVLILGLAGVLGYLITRKSGSR